MNLVLPDMFVAVIAILTGLLGVGRLTRVIVYDDFPPSVWWRMLWGRWTGGTLWEKLFTCWWCLSFWVSLLCIGWFLLIDVAPIFFWSWWVFWGALALSYVATMVIVRDEPRE